MIQTTQNNSNPFNMCANRVIISTLVPSTTELTQIVGLAPFRDLSQGDCRGIIGFCLPVLRGDSSFFLFKALGDQEMKLQKKDGNTWVDTLTFNFDVSNIYFTLYDKGTFSNEPNYFGVEVSWLSIFDNFGGGHYRFVFEPNIFSYEYYLMIDSCENKDKTVLINCVTKGKFNWSSSWWDIDEMDTTKYNWKDQIRVYGRFEMDGESPNTETSRIDVSLRNSKEVHKSINNTNYRLYIPQMPIELYNRFFYYMMNSKEIKMTDGNLDASDYYIDRKVIKNDTLPTLEQYRDSKLVYNVEFNFRDDKDFVFDE